VEFYAIVRVCIWHLVEHAQMNYIHHIRCDLQLLKSYWRFLFISSNTNFFLQLTGKYIRHFSLQIYTIFSKGMGKLKNITVYFCLLN